MHITLDLKAYTLRRAHASFCFSPATIVQRTSSASLPYISALLFGKTWLFIHFGASPGVFPTVECIFLSRVMKMVTI